MLNRSEHYTPAHSGSFTSLYAVAEWKAGAESVTEEVEMMGKWREGEMTGCQEMIEVGLGES